MFKVLAIPFIAAALAAVSALPAQAQGPVTATAPPPLITSPGSTEAGSFKAIEALATRLSCPFCDLSNAQLAGRDLTDANLQGANLTGADLSGANLSGAIVSRANLTNANLTNANLGRSDRGPADLVGANLTGARLAGADLDGTDLQYTDLSQTDLAQVDLGRARRGPSGLAQSGAPSGGPSCGSADLSGLKSRIYVATKGTDSDTCGDSPTAACASIAKGLARCSGKSACGVLTLYGEYTLQNSVALVPGVNLYGGCLSDQAPQPGLQSLLTAPPGGAPAITAIGIGANATVLQGFRLLGTAAATGSGAASTALVVKDSPALQVLEATILAGPGGSGAPGGTGSPGAGGVAGNGAAAGTQSQCPSANGGNGSVQMGVSVDVGVFKFSCSPSCSDNGCYGYWARQGAAGGQWGDQNCAECVSSRGSTGHTGGGGGDAGCGSKGSASANLAGAFSDTTWQGVTAGGATGGDPGGGGGGGGAGGYKAGACFWVKTEDPGNQGGGGGAGGCGGGGGGGGAQGGASFAVAVFGSSLSLTNSTLIGGRSGDGGAGGPGGAGGGRSSGAPGLTNHGGGYGGPGGSGGAGGAGGGGAGGNSGPAVVMALVGNAAVTGSGDVYYQGSAGSGGGRGVGGSPVVSGVCKGPDGDQGQSGVVAETYKY